MADSAALLVDEVLPYQAYAPMGAQYAVPVTVTLCQPAGGHEQGVVFYLGI